MESSAIRGQRQSFIPLHNRRGTIKQDDLRHICLVFFILGHMFAYDYEFLFMLQYYASDLMDVRVCFYSFLSVFTCWVYPCWLMSPCSWLSLFMVILDCLRRRAAWLCAWSRKFFVILCLWLCACAKNVSTTHYMQRIKYNDFHGQASSIHHRTSSFPVSSFTRPPLYSDVRLTSDFSPMLGTHTISRLL